MLTNQTLGQALSEQTITLCHQVNCSLFVPWGEGFLQAKEQTSWKHDITHLGVINSARPGASEVGDKDVLSFSMFQNHQSVFHNVQNHQFARHLHWNHQFVVVLFHYLQINPQISNMYMVCLSNILTVMIIIRFCLMAIVSQKDEQHQADSPRKK